MSIKFLVKKSIQLTSIQIIDASFIFSFPFCYLFFCLGDNKTTVTQSSSFLFGIEKLRIHKEKHFFGLSFSTLTCCAAKKLRHHYFSTFFRSIQKAGIEMMDLVKIEFCFCCCRFFRQLYWFLEEKI